MKAYFMAAMASIALFCSLIAGPAEARNNPAVQPIFFETLESALANTGTGSGSAPAPLSQDGSVSEVTLPGLAWAVANFKNDHIPLVIEFYSSNQNVCAVSQNQQMSGNECAMQMAVTAQAAAPYQDRVKFLRIDVSKYPVLLNGPDIRVLPSHIFISDYTDSNNYAAVKVWGYLSGPALQSVIKDTLAVDP